MWLIHRYQTEVTGCTRVKAEMWQETGLRLCLGRKCGDQEWPRK